MWTAASLRRDLYVSIADQRSGTNAIIYECGMGDGVYGVWLGLDSSRQVAKVLVDLELLSHSAELSPEKTHVGSRHRMGESEFGG